MSEELEMVLVEFVPMKEHEQLNVVPNALMWETEQVKVVLKVQVKMELAIELEKSFL